MIVSLIPRHHNKSGGLSSAAPLFISLNFYPAMLQTTSASPPPVVPVEMPAFVFPRQMTNAFIAAGTLTVTTPLAVR